MKKSFLIVSAVVIVVALAINFLLKDPQHKTPQDALRFANQSKQPELAEQIYFDLISSDSVNIDNHHGYITNHFDIPIKKKISKYDYRYRDDNYIKRYYYSKRRSNDSIQRDFGSYGEGLISSLSDNYPVALSCFQNVKNKDLKYLNNSIGSAYNHIGEKDSAEYFFRKEIANNGFISGAYKNLVRLLYSQERYDELYEILKTDELKPYFSNSTKRIVYFKKGEIANYFFCVFSPITDKINVFGFLGALLIMGSWLMYLRKIDIYETEKWKYNLLVLGLGMMFSFFVFILSDINNKVIGFNLNGGVVNDFFYCVTGIGAIEELVKIIPVLLLLRFTKQINEPFDYIKYASISALGFSFIENLEYFDEKSLDVIYARALLSSVGHMFYSSIIAYGMLLNKYKYQRNPVLMFLFFFLLAALAHGFYDFWLINPAVSDFKILTILFAIASIFIWNSFTNNALNNSTFFDQTKMLDAPKLRDYLFYSLSSVFIFEYIVLAFKFGPTVGNAQFFQSLQSGAYLLVFISSGLSNFKLEKGVWAPIHYWSNGQKVSNHDYKVIVGQKFIIQGVTRNQYTRAYLPNEAVISKNVTVSGEIDWYVLALEKPAVEGGNCKDQVLVRTKDKDSLIIKDEEIIVAFYIIPDIKLIENENIKRTDFKFEGWAIIKSK